MKIDKHYDTLIIGGGPAGLACAAGIKNGTVGVAEEHFRIGRPVQCSGIVTNSIYDIAKIRKNIILNKINRFSIRTASRKMEVSVKKPNIVLDREKFDLSMQEKAEMSGADVCMGYKYLGASGNKARLLDVKAKKEVNVRYNRIVGADGPFSRVAKENGLWHNRELHIGIQFRAELKEEIDRDAAEIYPAEGEFAWLLSENEATARIGMVSQSNSNPRQLFDGFLHRFRIKDNIKRIIEWQSGVIPYYNPKIRFSNGNAFLIGDSAGMIKNTTSGGILHGLKAAGILSDCINKREEHVEQSYEDYRGYESYESRARSEIRKDLWLHYQMRKVLNRLDEREWDRIITLMSSHKVRNVLESFDRDYPSRYLLKMLAAEPRLLLFARHLIA